MTLQFLDQTTLWSTLDALRHKTRGNRYIATAYLGLGIHQRFPLRANDVLLTSLSLRHAAAGLVSPS